MTTNTAKITAQLACELLTDNLAGVDAETVAAVIYEARAQGVAHQYWNGLAAAWVAHEDWVWGTPTSWHPQLVELDTDVARQLGMAADHIRYALRSLADEHEANVAHHVRAADYLVHGAQLVVSSW